ncbi:hypothetical protein CA54_47130 [Symmachiella macrocystis]|uniref:Transmembrane protein n=1 Tax=Symmachiella macrocystis TaxID=2527985 RepID=A0A5C6BD82_9PLAN|nr:hypothetical protein [Symmachiella macrocystis]TWU09471.1 hypothetical protein CA54_47130 [Symmachiella macrocystis]
MQTPSNALLQAVPFHQRRDAAIAMVAVSGLALFLVGVFLQVVAWEYPTLIYARFGEVEIPSIAERFLDMFGHRPHGYLAAVVFWFWWPMVTVLGYCHLRYPQPEKFSHAFLYGFVFCWLMFVFALSVMLMILSMSFILLLADLAEPPWYMSAIEPVSWVIPGCVGGYLTYTYWKFFLRQRIYNTPDTQEV